MKRQLSHPAICYNYKKTMEVKRLMIMSSSYKVDVMKRLETKVDRMIQQMGSKVPHFAGADGKYDDIGSDWWTTGFWPGILWVMYDMTGKEHYKKAAWH